MKDRRLFYLASFVFIGALFLVAAPLLLLFVFEATPTQDYLSGSKALFFFAAAMTGVVAIVEFLAMFFNHDAKWFTFALALCIFLSMFFSPEAQLVYGVDKEYEAVFDIFYYLCIVGSMASYAIFLVGDFSVALKKQESVILILISIAVLISYIPLRLFGLGEITIYPTIAFGLLFDVRAIYHIYKGKRINAVFILASAIHFAAMSNLTIASNYQMGLARYPAYGVASMFALVSTFFFVSIYILFVAGVIKNAERSQKFEHEVEALQAVVLQRQINPHFIFNALNIIKTTYQISPEEGERGIDLLAKFLRYNVESDDVYLVDFSKEIENVTYFVDFANIGQEREFEILYNIDCSDFKVPSLSLQPFIENIIRYSKINEKKDGLIEIETEETPSSYIIRIIDNGVGFEQVPNDGKHYGIANSKKRFELLLQAEVIVESKLGEGTTITITIPKKERVEGDKR